MSFLGSALSGIGNLIGGIVGSSAAKKAGTLEANADAGAQVSAAKYGTEATDYINQQLKSGQAGLTPYTSTGAQAEMTLKDLTSTPGQGLLSNFGGQFQAPTAGQAAATPGYQFALDQGQQAIQNSAAAKGNLLSSTALKGLDQYSQGLASTNYQQTYQNALGEFQQSYNIFNQNQAKQFNTLQTLAGSGQNAATASAQLGGQAAGQTAGALLGTAGQVGQAIEAGGQARAAGVIGAANAWQSALGGGVNAAGSAPWNTLGSISNPVSLGGLGAGGVDSLGQYS
jgi:hypothetical protein